MNYLDDIRQFTMIIADSGDIESIPAPPNPSLLLRALSHQQEPV